MSSEFCFKERPTSVPLSQSKSVCQELSPWYKRVTCEINVSFQAEGAQDPPRECQSPGVPAPWMEITMTGTTEMNLLGALQAVVLLEGAGVVAPGGEGATWTLARRGEEPHGVGGGGGRSRGWVPLGLSGQYLRTWGVKRETKGSPHHVAPNSLSGAAASQEPLKRSSRWRDCCWLPRAAGLVLSCQPSLP